MEQTFRTCSGESPTMSIRFCAEVGGLRPTIQQIQIPRLKRWTYRRAPAHSRVTLIVANASSESEIDAAFSTFVHARVNAILLGGDPLFLSRRVQLAVLAAKHAIPHCSR
jgi:hypothetical protein